MTWTKDYALEGLEERINKINAKHDAKKIKLYGIKRLSKDD